MKRKITAFLLLALIAAGVFCAVKSYRDYQKEEAMRFVKSLGNGINIGNSLDVKGLRERIPEATVTDFEVYWGNPVSTPELFQTIARSGIRSVRIPVSWGEHLGDGDRIDPEWMARVEEVVDDALDAGLYVILDLHHEAWLVPNEEQEAAVTDRLRSLWQQISRAFADRDEHLLFEAMNEPRLVGTQYEWTEGTEEAQAVVNRLNAVFVETVRSAGGFNGERWLLIPAYCTSGDAAALEALQIPEDEKTIVAVHAYYPYRFAQNLDDTRGWSRESDKDTQQLRDLIETLDSLFISRKIPVMITEFACKDKDNLEERLDWTDYYLSMASELGIPCFWWDNGKTTQILDRADCVWTMPELRDCLLKHQP